MDTLSVSVAGDPVFIGWDVGGWNCDRNSKSRDALVVLDASGETLAGAPQALPRADSAVLPSVTVVIKAHVDRVAEESLTQAGTARWLTTPTPFNAVLWRAVAMTGDGHFLEGYYSLLDSERRFSLVSRADGHELLEPLRAEAPVERLVWFSRGFFAGRERECGGIVIADLRMGLEEQCAFSFVVGRRDGGAVEPARVRQEPDSDYAPGSGGQLWDRILGRSSHPACILGC